VQETLLEGVWDYTGQNFLAQDEKGKRITTDLTALATFRMEVVGCTARTAAR
jgi:hypothetical protein